jgi:chromosomal replication initiator protein
MILPERPLIEATTKDCVLVWKNCLRLIRASVGEQSFRTWFEPIRPVKLQNSILTIQVPSQFFYEWLEEHYVNVLKKAIYGELGAEGKLEYSIIIDKGNEQHQPYTINISNPKNAKPVDHSPLPPQKQFFSPFDMRTAPPHHAHSNLNGQYSFDNFIEGECNRLAYSASFTVAQNPGSNAFNPLVIHGGVGLGKTHLLHALGNEVKALFPEKFVLYVPSDLFITQFVDALKNQSVQEFTNYYMQVDVLLVDDIQFLAGKEKTQENFFHIFNHLHQAGKQIVMTCDIAPKDLKGLHDRLLSRFKWGLVADVQVPDYQTRLSIVRAKMQTEGIAIPNEIVEYVAKNVDTNVRELQGVLISLVAKASLMRQEIDIDMTEKTLNQIIQRVKQIEVDLNIEIIQKAVAEHFNVSLNDLKSETRKKEIANARQIAMFICQNYTNMSLKTIGEYFGGRDHSTVSHASRTVTERLDNDPLYKNIIDVVKMKLNLKS